MSLATNAFKLFREKALVARKEKFILKNNLEVTTTKEIADALKRTSLVSGIIILYIINKLLVGRGRTVALLAGSGSKKRKLNPDAAKDQT